MYGDRSRTVWVLWEREVRDSYVVRDSYIVRDSFVCIKCMVIEVELCGFVGERSS